MTSFISNSIFAEHAGLSYILYSETYDQVPSADKIQKLLNEHPVLFGTMVTGEQFIEDEKREEINQKFDPLSTDMETAGVAHVCYVNRIPFLAVRTITDTVTHQGIETFDQNCEAASEISAEIVLGILGQLD